MTYMRKKMEKQDAQMKPLSDALLMKGIDIAIASFD